MDDTELSGELTRLFMQLEGADPKTVAALLKAIGQLNPRKQRGRRAAMLQQVFRRAAQIAQACDFEGSVVLRKGQVLMDHEGVLLAADDESRYFRRGGLSAARPMLRVLQKYGVPLRTVFDVGANLGEIALYFAHKVPDARVFAFEPAPENLAAFNANLALQPAPLANLQLIAAAVSDRQGEIDITIGGRDLNTVLVEGNIERIRERGAVTVQSVPTDTLDAYCRRLDVEEIDFLKVDIEGAEPLLAQALIALKGRVHASFVEMTRFNSIEAYEGLAKAYETCGLALLDADMQPVDDAAAWVREGLEQRPGMNVWFLRRDYL